MDMEQGTADAVLNTRRKYKDRITPNIVAIKALAEQGLKPQEIARMLGLSDTYCYKIAQEAKKDEFQALRPTALRTVKSLIKGEPVGKIKQVKCSTALAASKEVLDRTDPKQSEAESGPKVSFTTINLNMVANQRVGERDITAAPPCQIADKIIDQSDDNDDN